MMDLVYTADAAADNFNYTLSSASDIFNSPDNP